MHGGGPSLLASFQYHEIEYHTMLSWDEISSASAACGNCGIIILTRDFHAGSEWRSGVEAVLSHPFLYGVAMEFNPSNYGQRCEGDFVDTVLGANRSPFFLLPFLGPSYAGPVAEDRIRQALTNFKSQTKNMDRPEVRVVLARYDPPHLPIAGPTNSIEAALQVAKQMQSKSKRG